MEFAQEIEKTIARKVVSALIDAGYSIGVNDGEETTVNQSTDQDKILGALCTTEEDYILTYDQTGKRTGWVWLIWGNGEDLISDHTVNLAPIIDPLILE
jgi:hypothetical protein